MQHPREDGVADNFCGDVGKLVEAVCTGSPRPYIQKNRPHNHNIIRISYPHLDVRLSEGPSIYVLIDLSSGKVLLFWTRPLMIWGRPLVHRLYFIKSIGGSSSTLTI